MKAKGILQHHFWGDYHAGIALVFPSADHAAGALEMLPGWKVGKREDVLTLFCSSDQLDKVKEQFKRWKLEIEPCGRRDCRGQCQHEEIDGVPHSIDFGPSFTVDIPAVPASQLKLFDIKSV